ncbi:MAG: hypothetical protein U0R80_01420 [Nocardioidaceae bacterium]
MAWRGTGALVALALVGGGGGYAVAASAGTSHGTEPRPLVASDPSFPQAIPITVKADPDYPTLLPGVPLRRVRLGATYGASVEVPRGWLRNDTGVLGEWNYAPAGSPLNSYVLRVKLVGSQRSTIGSALTERMARLQAAEAIKRFHLEDQGPDSFVATYVQVDPENDEFAGYARLTMERFLTLPGSGNAEVEVAVTGRLSDRAGLADLLQRVSDSVVR